MRALLTPSWRYWTAGTGAAKDVRQMGARYIGNNLPVYGHPGATALVVDVAPAMPENLELEPLPNGTGTEQLSTSRCLWGRYVGYVVSINRQKS